MWHFGKCLALMCCYDLLLVDNYIGKISPRLPLSHPLISGDGPEFGDLIHPRCIAFGIAWANLVPRLFHLTGPWDERAWERGCAWASKIPNSTNKSEKKNLWWYHVQWANPGASEATYSPQRTVTERKQPWLLALFNIFFRSKVPSRGPGRNICVLPRKKYLQYVSKGTHFRCLDNLADDLHNKNV